MRPPDTSNITSRPGGLPSLRSQVRYIWQGIFIVDGVVSLFFPLQIMCFSNLLASLQAHTDVCVYIYIHIYIYMMSAINPLTIFLCGLSFIISKRGPSNKELKCQFTAVPEGPGRIPEGTPERFQQLISVDKRVTAQGVCGLGVAMGRTTP
jgi:hypothetical protein